MSKILHTFAQLFRKRVLEFDVLQKKDLHQEFYLVITRKDANRALAIE